MALVNRILRIFCHTVQQLEWFGCAELQRFPLQYSHKLRISSLLACRYFFFSSGFIPVWLSTVFAASFAHWLRWNVEIIIQTIVYLAILIDIWTKLYLFTSHRTVCCALSWRFWTRLVVWVAHISIAAHKQVIYAAHLTNCRCQFKFIGIYLGFQRFSCDVTISQRTKMVDCYNSKWILGARNDSWLFFLKKKN